MKLKEEKLAKIGKFDLCVMYPCVIYAFFYHFNLVRYNKSCVLTVERKKNTVQVGNTY